MTTYIQTSAIQGPPFHCPECASNGDKKSFTARQSLGTHRFGMHGVSGTSTGSVAYKTGKLEHKIKRTYIKRTYNKTKPQSNPLLDMVNKPGETILEIHSAIADKVLAIENLRRQIADLNSQVNILEKFQDMLNSATKQDVADEPHFAVSA